MDYSDKIFEILDIEPDKEFYVEDENKNIVKIKIASNLYGLVWIKQMNKWVAFDSCLIKILNGTYKIMKED